MTVKLFKRNWLAWCFLAVFLCTIGLPIIQPSQAKAATQADWVDAAHIKLGNDLFFDTNPYDTNSEYTATINGCSEPSRIKLNSGTTANSFGDVTIMRRGSDGRCTEQTDKINVGSVQNIKTAFYRLSDSVIMATVGQTCNGNPLSANLDHIGSVYYKKVDSNDPSFESQKNTIKDAIRNGNAYFRVNDQGNVDFNDLLIDDNGGQAHLATFGCKGVAGFIPDPPIKANFADGGKTVTAPAWAPFAPVGSNLPGAPANPGGALAKSCETYNTNAALSWLVCGLINLLDDLTTLASNTIDSLLTVNTDNFSKVPQLKIVWSLFRNIATFALVAVALVMLLGQAAGSGGEAVFSAYTMRKVLPRLLIALIGIQLSWYIMVELINIVNDLSHGVEGLMYAPFGGADKFRLGVILNGSSINQGLFSTLSAGGAFTALGAYLTIGSGSLLGIAAAASTAVIALVIGLFTLFLRRAILVSLIMIAPLALALWVLPNTEKLWKMWHESFSKLLIVYPLILFVIAGGRIFAYTAGQMGDQNQFGQMGAIVFGVFGVYALVPALMKLAGAAYNFAAGTLNNPQKGIFDRLRKIRAGEAEKNLAAFKQGNRFEGKRWLPGTQAAASRFNAISRGVSTGTRGNFGLGTRGRQAAHQAIETAAMQAMKSEGFQAISQNDDALHAGTYDTVQEARRDLMARWGDANRVNNAIAAYSAAGFKFGDRSAQYAAARQLVSTGTGFNDNGIQGMVETFGRVAHGSSATAAALSGFGNSEAKRVGHADWAPGFGNLNNLVQAQTHGRPPRAADYTAATRQAWDSVDMNTLVRGKPQQTEAFASYNLERLQNGNQVEKREAAVALMEMQNSLPGATGGNQRIINQTMHRLRNEVGTRLGLDFNQVGPGGVSASVEDQLAAVATHNANGRPAIDYNGQQLTGSTIRGLARVYDQSTPISARGGGNQPPNNGAAGGGGAGAGP